MDIANILFDDQDLLWYRHQLTLRVELHTGLLIGCILDNTHKTLKRTLPNHDCLVDHPVSTKAPGRRHSAARTTRATPQSRVHLCQIRSRRSASFGGNRHDICRTDDSDTGILRLRLVMQEEERSEDVQDDSIPLLSINLPNRVTVSNFGPVAIGRYRIPTRSNLVSYLCGKNSSERTILVEYSERLAVNLDNASDSSSTIPD